MNLADVQTLVDYHCWARDRVLDAAERLPPELFTRRLDSSFPSVRETLVHLHSADWIWCSRWEGESPAAMLDPAAFADVPAIRRAAADLERRLRGLVARLGEDGVARTIEYRTTEGKLYAQPFWQLLQHVVNHGSYHRGQVTTLLRQLGAPPPKSMDLVAFYREQASSAL